MYSNRILRHLRRNCCLHFVTEDGSNGVLRNVCDQSPDTHGARDSNKNYASKNNQSNGKVSGFFTMYSNVVKIGATPYRNFIVHYCEKQTFGGGGIHRVFKKFPTVHGKRNFITTLTRTRYFKLIEFSQ